MIEPFRSDFNNRFTQGKYQEVVARLNQLTGTEIEFRMAETPCFFEPSVLGNMVQVGEELTLQLVNDPDYLRRSETAIPDKYRVPGRDSHPHFMTVDFGFVRGAGGELEIRLVEMQAFPSIFGFQPAFGRTYKEVFELDDRLRYLFGDLTDTSYWDLLRQVIVGDHDPAHVVLLEIEPESQKTLPDFRMHERHLGIRTVDLQTVVKRGDQLFYPDARRSGALTPIRRIYNRAIVDELIRKEIQPPFDYREALDVEWAGHPNWYFQISKFSLPFLRHPAVPAAVFLDDWFAGKNHSRLPEDPEQWILKPLYSFAGKGIVFAPGEELLRSIPEVQRSEYLLQERVTFEPVIRTPEGMTQAEVRILYVWPEGRSMVPMTTLVRMGRGMMMGVDHNRDRTWVGGTAGLFLPAE